MRCNDPCGLSLAAQRQRRAFLARGLELGLGGLCQRATARHVPDAVPRAAGVPPTRVSLADYGGVPGAGRSILVSAFGQAFAALAETGGGTLFIPPGLYDFGSYADSAYIVLCRGLRDVAISAYGARFQATTTARAMPTVFYFFNFHNITIAGASFVDPGFTPWLNWKGMYCVGLQADAPSRGLRMVDCHAERVVGLLVSNNDAASRQYISGVSVHGRVEHAYYGVGASFIREDVRVELACHNVRRAFIANALNRADIAITSSNSFGWPGSNGLVALVSTGASTGNVENVRVKVSVTGECNHASYVHFYHQGPEREGWMRDIDATVDLLEVKRARNIFMFAHETDGIAPTTARIWDRIALHGRLAGNFSGSVVAKKSASTSPGTVFLDRELARRGNMNVLPEGFRFAPPHRPVPPG